MSRPLPICPVCQRPGWNAQKPVQWTINNGRVSKFRGQLRGLVDDGDGQLRVYRCGPTLGLWHLTNLSDERFQLVIAPMFLELPPAPQPLPPRMPVAPWQDHLCRVAAAVTLAIHTQDRGRAMPSAGVFAARYSVPRSWVCGLVEDFAGHGLLRRIGGLYVTGTVRSGERPSS